MFALCKKWGKCIINMLRLAFYAAFGGGRNMLAGASIDAAKTAPIFAVF